MKATLRHWGPISVGVASKSTRTPLLRIIDSELRETRAFSEQLYRAARKAGARILASKLVEDKSRQGWPRFPSS